MVATMAGEGGGMAGDGLYEERRTDKGFDPSLQVMAWVLLLLLLL